LHNLKQDPDNASAAGDLEELAKATLREVRQLSRGLRPAELDDQGLLPALETLLKNFQTMSGLDVDFYSQNVSARLPRALETALFRIAQEALTNITKHAGARTVSLILESDNKEVRLIIEDDGRGLPEISPHPNPSAPGDEGNIGQTVTSFAPRDDRSGLGLIGIRERLALLGGTFHVESAARQGTTLYVTIPLPEDSHDSDSSPDRG
jgi:signal transduction histidine kinase